MSTLTGIKAINWQTDYSVTSPVLFCFFFFKSLRGTSVHYSCIVAVLPTSSCGPPRQTFPHGDNCRVQCSHKNRQSALAFNFPCTSAGVPVLKLIYWGKKCQVKEHFISSAISLGNLFDVNDTFFWRKKKSVLINLFKTSERNKVSLQ